MALIETDTQYHVALNGIGMMLQNAPAAPAYQVAQAPLYNARFGQGDRSYSDFSFWWFWAQTSFGGYKQDKTWEDDGDFLESEGVNVSIDPGLVTLNYKQLGTGSVAKNITMYDAGDPYGNVVIVGRNETDQKMLAVDATGATVWQDTAVGANEEILCAAELGDGYMYIGCHTVGSGASMLKKGNGGAFSDVGTFTSGLGIWEMVPYPDGDSIYLFTYNAGIWVYNRAAGTFTQKKTTYPFGLTQDFLGMFIVREGKGAWLIGDRIYFTLKQPNIQRVQLWAYDIGSDVYVMVYNFLPGQAPIRIVEYNQMLYLFDPGGYTGHLNVLRYNPGDGTMQTIIEIGRDSGTAQIVANPTRAGDGIYFAVDDGTSDFQIWQMTSDEKFFSAITPPSVFQTHIDMLCMTGNGNLLLEKHGASGTNKFYYHDSLPQNDYQTTGYLVTSIFDGTISALDKLFYDITINFNTLASGQAIQILYSTDGGATFTSIGSASFSSDGAIKSKTFRFGDAVVAKKFALKFVLTGGGTTTPGLADFSVRYIPFVNYTKLWTLRINAADEVKRLNGGLLPVTARELKGMLENSWWTKSVLDFQDLDYAQTQINAGAGLSASNTTITVDDTSGFPEQGRLLIEDECVLYTGKSPTTFTGCTRGARETRATTHADNVVVSNAYKVIITDLGAVTPILLEGKNLEYIINLQLREV